MPFIATGTFASQVREFFKRNGWTRISNTGTLIASGTEQNYLALFVWNSIPSVVSCADDFAVVAPSIRERVLIRRIIPVEPQAKGFPFQMLANKRLVSFPVGITMNGLRHSRIFAGTATEVNAIRIQLTKINAYSAFRNAISCCFSFGVRFIWKR
jgi:hypothetical protein